jgi:hypothetical protein
MAPSALVEEPTAVATALVVGIGLIFFLAGRRRLAGLFRYVPPISWA